MIWLIHPRSHYLTAMLRNCHQILSKALSRHLSGTSSSQDWHAARLSVEETKKMHFSKISAKWSKVMSQTLYWNLNIYTWLASNICGSIPPPLTTGHHWFRGVLIGVFHWFGGVLIGVLHWFGGVLLIGGHLWFGLIGVRGRFSPTPPRSNHCCNKMVNLW